MVVPKPGRYNQHRSTGKIKKVRDQKFADHARPQGWGPGAKLHLSTEATLQGGVGMRAIDCGIGVERAYDIAECVVWSGVGGLGGADAEFNQRLPGPAFKQGETWIAISLHPSNYAGAKDFAVFSDRDPLLGGSKGSQLSNLESSLANAFGGAPFVLMSLNGIWSEIASKLDLSPNAIREGLG